MHTDWEQNVFAGLEELDSEGEERVSHLGRLDESPDEPEMVASGLPPFDEFELEAQPPRLA